MGKLPNGYWNKNRTIKESKKYKKLTVWAKNSSGSYDSAKNNGWLEECSSHMKRRNNLYWNFERCKKESLKYKTKKQWKIESPSSYSKALRSNWIDECSQHMQVLGHLHKRGLYAIEFIDNTVYIGLTCDYDRRYIEHKIDSFFRKKLIKMKHNYVKMNVFYEPKIAAKKERELIEIYRKSGWKILNKAKGGSLGGKGFSWDFKSCLKSALLYTTRNNWRLGQNGAYGAARKNGWLNDCCKHMKPPRVFWTLEECLKDAKKFLNKNEWRTKSIKSYKAAQKNGWINKCAEHMKDF